MLQVDDCEKIKKAVLRDGMSRREAARTFGHGRDTIRKILANALPPGYRRTKEPIQPVIEPVKHILDAWLEDERQRGVPRKQRSNATVLWKRLCADYGFKGSVYPVRNYLRKKKRGQEPEVFFPLWFAPGEEGQVDWGTAWVTICGRPTQVHLFCLRLCYSRATYVRAYPCEKLECFLDGHVRAFRFFGGVPRSNAYDNLKTAVTWVGAGRLRRLHERFVELRCHYVFDHRFCNVASGNEKGRVENLVKLAQSNFLAGAPQFGSFDDLNAHLESCCRADLERPAPHSQKLRKELLTEEQAVFLPLAHGDFEACVKHSTISGKLSLVQYATNFYSVPVRWAHHPVCLKAFADRVELVCGQETVAVHPRCWQRQQHILEYTHYLPLLERKPGGLKHARPFKGEPWGEEFTRFRLELEFRRGGDGTREFIEVLLLFTKYPEEVVKAAVRECLRLRAFTAEAVKGMLGYRPPVKGGVVDVSRHPVLQLRTDGIRPAAEYDAVLLSRKVVAS